MLERIWAFDPLTASILGGATYITWSVTGIAVSRVPARLSGTCLWLGPLMLALGLVLGAIAMPLLSLGLLLAGLVSVGIGYGLSWGFLSQAIMTGAGPGDRDRASAMLPTVLSTGLAIGAALGGVAANTAGLTERSPPDMVARAGLFCFVLAAVIGGASFLAALRLRAARGTANE
jgi:predicted MFS family arabinose efflux permease